MVTLSLVPWPIALSKKTLFSRVLLEKFLMVSLTACFLPFSPHGRKFTTNDAICCVLLVFVYVSVRQSGISCDRTEQEPIGIGRQPVTCRYPGGLAVQMLHKREYNKSRATIIASY